MTVVVGFGPHHYEALEAKTFVSVALVALDGTTPVATYDSAGTTPTPITVDIQRGYLTFFAAPGTYELQFTLSDHTSPIITKVSLVAAPASSAPVSPLQQAAINTAASAAQAAAISAAATDATTKVASEASARNTAITNAINGLLGGAPGALDTLKELADAINDDASFAATITNALAGKQPLDSDLTAIAALSTTTFGRAFLTMADAAATKTVLALVKGDVGLGNVDNTADTAKPVSTAQAAAFAPTTTTTIDLIDRTNNTTETVPAGTTTNCSTAGVTKTAPALDNPVATPPKRFAIKNLSTGSITVAYPDQAGSAQSLTMLTGETRTFRQKSTSGWGVESGAVALATLDARYAPPAGVAFLDVVGHSIPGGGWTIAGAGVTGNEFNAYPFKLAFMLGSPRRIRNFANGGSVSCWQSNFGRTGDGGWGHVVMYASTAPPVGTNALAPTLDTAVGPAGGSNPALPQADLVIVHAALNDLGALGSANPTPMLEAHRSIIVRMCSAATAKVGDSTLAYTGTWSSGNFGGQSTQPDGLKFTTTVGDKFTWSVPIISSDAGTRTIGFSINVNSGKDLTLGVTLDGVAQPDVRLQGSVLCDTGGYQNANPQNNLITRRYSVDQTVAHTLVVTLKTVTIAGSTLILDSCHIEADPADGPVVVIPNNHRCTSYALWNNSAFAHGANVNDAAIAAWNTSLQTLTAEFPQILWVDIDSALNRDAGLLFGDGVHPNNAGHGVIAQAIYDALLASKRLTSRQVSRVSPNPGEFWRPVGAGINNYPAFANGWINYGAPYSTCAFFKDVNGRVHLKGAVKNGSSASAVIFTLPVGYRPAETRLFPAYALGAAQVLINATGQVNVNVGGTTGSQILDGISFVAEQ